MNAGTKLKETPHRGVSFNLIPLSEVLAWRAVFYRVFLDKRRYSGYNQTVETSKGDGGDAPPVYAKMKRKIMNAVGDILLIMVAFSLTDWITLHVLNTEKWWAELPVYLAMYAMLAAVRWLMRRAWRRLTKHTDTNNNETDKE